MWKRVGSSPTIKALNTFLLRKILIFSSGGGLSYLVIMIARLSTIMVVQMRWRTHLVERL
jgi:hypothetical protein